MLCKSPRESALLAEGHLKNGTQAAERARARQRVRRIAAAPRGAVSGPACLLP
jgi:hypothetical protein